MSKISGMSKISAIHITKHTSPKHSGTVIFFHGSGATGDHLREWVSLISKSFSFSHIKVVYPTAPLQPYTPVGGMKSNVWFDREDVSPHVPEKLESLECIKRDVQNLIKQENDAGIPTSRIVVGGFSMGGALALHTAYRWERDVAGAFAFSSFLNDNSVVYKELKHSSGNLPPLLQIHGDSDDLVDLSWGQTTFNHLNTCGVRGEFHIMERLGHSINKRGMNIIKQWIDKILPDL